jgi:teichuronic acid biosynthesis glycosyltransferase TuaG
MSFLAYHRINEHGRVISSKIGTPKQIGYTKLLWHNLIIFSTAMIRKDALGDIKFKKVGHEDWVFWLDFFKRNGDGFGLNDLLVEYRIRSGSVSANKLKAAEYTWLILRESEKIGFLRSAYLFSKYAFATVWKRLK